MTPRSSPHEFVQLQTTLDDRGQAEKLVRGAVERHLAACGQLVGPITSIYRWRGAVEEAEEWLCIFKTTARRAPELEEWLLEEHPYEVPEIVVLGIEKTSIAYGDWITHETSE